jgi:hypothetical protein
MDENQSYVAIAEMKTYAEPPLVFSTKNVPLHLTVRRQVACYGNIPKAISRCGV